MKAYIASENAGITTSSGMVKDLFRRSIELGRQYARDGNKNDFFEALRLLGTGLHCIEGMSFLALQDSGGVGADGYRFLLPLQLHRARPH